MTNIFQHEYDLDSLSLIQPTSRSFQMYVTPRYLTHYVTNSYEKATADLVARLVSSVDVFVDIGAHYGFFSLLASHHNRELQVLAIEPTPISCEVLRRNVALFGSNRIEVHQVAVSATTSIAKYNVSLSSDNCSFYEHPNAPPVRQIDVNTIALDSLMTNLGAGRLLIKVDTDGHELAVLAGMRRTLDRAEDVRLIVELNPKMQHRAGHNPNALLDELEKLGFCLFLIDDERRRFYRIHPGTELSRFMDADSYANVYCVPNAKSISVVFFSHSPHLAGAERSLIELVDELVADHGAICTVVTPGHGPLVDAMEAAGASTIVEQRLGWWAAFPTENTDTFAIREGLVDGSDALLSMMPVLQAIDPDVVYTQTITLPWGASAAALLDKPHVWSICEFGEMDYGLAFLDPFSEVIEQVKSGATVILSACEAIRKTLFSDLSSDRALTVYRHIPMRHVPISPAFEVFAGKAATRLAVFGTLVEGKGQLDAIEAVAKLLARGRDVELLLAGYAAPEYRKKCDAIIAERCLGGRVRISDFLADPYPAMMATDIMLVCSRHEAFGRVAVEGMLLGRPIIYPRSGGIPEYMQDGVTGLSYLPGDIDELVTRIEELIDDPERAARLGNQASRHASAKFTRDEYGGAIWRIFRNIGGQAHSRVAIPKRVVSSMAAVAARAADREVKIKRLDRELSDIGVETADLREAVEARDEQIATLNLSLTAREAKSVSLEQSLSELSNELSIVRIELAAREAKSVSLERSLSELSNELGIVRTELAAREVKSISLEHSLSELSNELGIARADLAAREANIASLETTISRVYDSTSWRVTAPLRWLKRLVAKLY